MEVAATCQGEQIDYTSVSNDTQIPRTTVHDYFQIKSLRYWRTSQQVEVDFILDDTVAIEVKGTAQITAQDLSGLIRLKEEEILKKNFLVYTGETISHLDVDPEIEIIPYRTF